MFAKYKPVFTTLKPFDEYNGKTVNIPINFVSENGEKSNEMYLTNFNQEKYVPLPKEGGKFNLTRAQRNCFQSRLDKKNPNARQIIENHEIFETIYEETKEKIFKNNELKNSKGRENFQFINCLKEKGKDPDYTSENIYGIRFGFKTRYCPYYNGEKLNEANRKIFTKSIFPNGKVKRGEELKKYKETLEFNINYPQDTDNKKLVKYNEIEEIKEFNVRIVYHEVTVSNELKGLVDGVRYISNDTKKPDEYTDLDDEEQIEQFVNDYGKSESFVVETPEELEKYLGYQSYYRYGDISYEFYCDKPEKKKIVDCGIRAYCAFVQIVNIKTDFKKSSNENDNIMNKLYKNTLNKNTQNSDEDKSNNNSKSDTESKKSENENESESESESESDSDSDSDNESN